MNTSFAATASFARFGAEVRLENLPSEVVNRAKLLLLDTLGVALAAYPEPLGQRITRYVESLGGQPESTVLGAGWRTSAPLAALANGTLASALDFDAGFHFTTHLFPASLAVGEKVQAPGARVLEALVAGYEASARLTEILDGERSSGGGVTTRGWYHVGLVGPIVSALAAGMILQLDAERQTQALGIAAATAGGVRRNFGTMAKAFQAGNSAAQGVHAALLAAAGFTGDPEILEAPLGLFAALGVPPDAAAERAFKKLGSTFELLASLRIKRFPACTPAHRPIQALLALRREHGFAPDDVACIEADLHTFSLVRLDPQDEVEAGFSLPFLLAVALVDGAVTLDQLHHDRIRDVRLREVMTRVKPLADSAPTGRDDEREIIRVTLRDGSVLVGEVSGTDRVESESEIEDKFRRCSSRVLGTDQIEQLLQRTMRLEELPRVNELLSSTSMREP